MERVVTINLNGNPYQLEEPAYDALRTYLSRAQTALADNPDKAEIVRDLEQAIADKCSGYLSPGKTVVLAAEMTRILDEMGPVEGEGGQQQDNGAGAGASDDYVRPTRRLYRIYDRHAWTGVSAGLAAYAGIDVAWVRILWILSAIFTGGFTVLVYLVLIFAMPVASSSEDLAAAHGAPFNAQEVIDRAKREYGKFAEDSARTWRAENRRWRRTWREHSRGWGRNSSWDGPAVAEPPARNVGYIERVFAGVFALVFSVITAVLLIAFLIALFALLTTGGILGWFPPLDAPFWLVIVILCILYAAISAPFSALRRASYATVSGRPYGGAGDGLVTLLIVAVALWFAWAFLPDAREMMEQAYVVVRDFVTHDNWVWDWN